MIDYSLTQLDKAVWTCVTLPFTILDIIVEHPLAFLFMLVVLCIVASIASESHLTQYGGEENAGGIPQPSTRQMGGWWA